VRAGIRLGDVLMIRTERGIKTGAVGRVGRNGRQDLDHAGLFDGPL
jgi:hypothetical protein